MTGVPFYLRAGGFNIVVRLDDNGFAEACVFYDGEQILTNLPAYELQELAALIDMAARCSERIEH